MCGIAGFLGYSEAGAEQVPAILFAMGNAIRYRGPDDSGVWYDDSEQIALSHQRLSIVDLSPAGHQPMVSMSGRYVITFNGEIYNHLALRRELQRAVPLELSWRGRSDTETLLAGIDAWGLRDTLLRAVGMFAFAVWDRQTRVLSLARDRTGEKPLYYGWQGRGAGRTFLFGSELGALKAHPQFAASIDRGAITLLMRHNYVPAPYSIYEGIAKLEPGTLLEVSLARQLPRSQPYWSFTETARAGKEENRFTETPEQAVDDLEALLTDAIKQQMIADVPLGAFLSGGIDSTTVVALMQTQASRPVKTFTIGFFEPGYNEAVHAAAVAARLGTDHTELYVTPEQAMDVIPSLPHLYSEPFADSSQIPTFLVSHLARQHVTVTLSGDGGDELFAGYARYEIARKWQSRIGRVPRQLRLLIASAVRRAEVLLPDSGLPRMVRDRLELSLGMLASKGPDDLYRILVSQVINPCDWVSTEAVEPLTALTKAGLTANSLQGIERMMALDSISYLPEDILVKVDRAAMAVGLESRVPLLDHRVIDFAWRLPMAYKVRDGMTKWPLRQVLYRYVPKELMDRPKSGFAVPLSDWLRGPLREWAEHLLAATRLDTEGYFHTPRVRRAWIQHLAGQRNWSQVLWIILMFQAWLENERKLSNKKSP